MGFDEMGDLCLNCQTDRDLQRSIMIDTERQRERGRPEEQEEQGNDGVRERGQQEGAEREAVEVENVRFARSGNMIALSFINKNQLFPSLWIKIIMLPSIGFLQFSHIEPDMFNISHINSDFR